MAKKLSSIPTLSEEEKKKAPQVVTPPSNDGTVPTVSAESIPEASQVRSNTSPVKPLKPTVNVPGIGGEDYSIKPEAPTAPTAPTADINSREAQLARQQEMLKEINTKYGGNQRAWILANSMPNTWAQPKPQPPSATTVPSSRVRPTTVVSESISSPDATLNYREYDLSGGDYSQVDRDIRANMFRRYEDKTAAERDWNKLVNNKDVFSKVREEWVRLNKERATAARQREKASSAISTSIPTADTQKLLTQIPERQYRIPGLNSRDLRALANLGTSDDLEANEATRRDLNFKFVNSFLKTGSLPKDKSLPQYKVIQNIQNEEQNLMKKYKKLMNPQRGWTHEMRKRYATERNEDGSETSTAREIRIYNLLKNTRTREEGRRALFEEVIWPQLIKKGYGKRNLFDL